MKQAKANHATKLRVAVSSVASVDTGGFRSGLLLTQLPDSSPASPSFIFSIFVYCGYFSSNLYSSREGVQVVATDINPTACLIGFPVYAKRQRGDSNPCGQSPMDF